MINVEPARVWRYRPLAERKAAMKNVTSCCTRIRAGLRSHLPLLLAAVALTGLPMTSQASATATVTGITYKQGSSSIDVVIAIPRRISRSARKNNKNHQLWVTVTYGSVNNTFETVDSGTTPGGH